MEETLIRAHAARFAVNSPDVRERNKARRNEEEAEALSELFRVCAS